MVQHVEPVGPQVESQRTPAERTAYRQAPFGIGRELRGQHVFVGAPTRRRKAHMYTQGHPGHFAVERGRSAVAGRVGQLVAVCVRARSPVPAVPWALPSSIDICCPGSNRPEMWEDYSASPLYRRKINCLEAKSIRRAQS